jgi:Spy/CpxP family protein refolding chaperone
MAPGMHGGKGMHGGMGMRGGRGMMRGRMMHMRMAQLGLSDAQRDRLQALHEANARKAVQRRADVQLAQMDLRKLVRSDKPDQAAINAQVDKIAKLRADGIKAAIDMRLQARTVFTPEQWKKLHSPPDGMGMHAPGMGHDHDGAPGKGKD